MSERSTVMRALHELGLGAWFGGSLMGAVGLNGAANSMGDRGQTRRISSAGWAKWAPVNAAALGAYVVGGVGLLKANRARIKYQQGVAASSFWKSAVTGAALAATAYSAVLGKRVAQATSEQTDESHQPHPGQAPDVAAIERRLRVTQWAVPALTGALVVRNALQGEQQRGDQEIRGYLAQNLWPLG